MICVPVEPFDLLLSRFHREGVFLWGWVGVGNLNSIRSDPGVNILPRLAQLTDKCLLILQEDLTVICTFPLTKGIRVGPEGKGLAVVNGTRYGQFSGIWDE